MAGVEGDETMSMAELLAQEEASLQQIVPGTIVKGVVASKRAGEIFVDIGAKYEGLVEPKDLENFSPEEIAAIKVGDTIPVYVLRMQTDEEDHIRLSLSQAKAEKDWDDAEQLFKAGDIVESEVIGNNKGGLIVSFGHVRGFVPGSQLTSVQYSSQNKGERWDELTGEILQLKIIEVDRTRNRLIFSERAASDDLRKEKAKEKAKLLEDLSEGDIRPGRVTSLADFGAFVDIGGIDGLIHLSELAWTHVSHPNEILNVGDEIDVYILKVEHDQQRVALSLKRLQPEPWSEVFDHYQINQVVDAVITKLTNFGAFARIDNRIEGLIHISEISEKNIAHPKDVVSEEQEVKVRIIHIDPERRRMGLSMKQVEDQENWAEYQDQESSADDTSGDNNESDEASESQS
ncbi:MAG TPA: S1 RNA-binding domain-containing protein [Anaerolineae bacterium]|nr:S1 RNA-binding domain-containing protein [Anaerolineae bacterium]MCB0180618.1 S1 RNA-binding domain-containing protein [Anaerolineae bacterium]MCB0224688.1 S1 RNA-binding domain-containing protein [Anaerolineae bacterium]MCB9103566.1 S1 RNA-binding domain-containing protein [Anaerolineales bacterium]HRV93470.1 S1 RNA-binding domain-containing protein [Anaerolineae bacterium]